MPKKLLLVDVDCGLDDAQALMMALAAPEVEILGITCCFGNTTAENVCRNVLRVLQVCKRMEIPVFCGASQSLLGNINQEYEHFGGDGLGDAGDPSSPGLDHIQEEDAVHALIRIISQYEGQIPVFCGASQSLLGNINQEYEHFGGDGLGDAGDPSSPGLDHIQEEDAVHALIRIISQYEGQISVVAVGPLTNLALAAKMDPTLPKKINKLYIMGGNMEGRGNRTVCAEFNFYLDPEAAYIVTNEFTCPIFIAALEFTWENSLTMEYFRNWVEQDTDKARFMKKITAKWQQKHGFVSYDSYAMAAAIDESIVTEYLECAVSVELHGRYARGMLVLDTEDKWKKQQKVVLMKKCNLEKFKERLWAALQ